MVAQDGRLSYSLTQLGENKSPHVLTWRAKITLMPSCSDVARWDKLSIIILRTGDKTKVKLMTDNRNTTKPLSRFLNEINFLSWRYKYSQQLSLCLDGFHHRAWPAACSRGFSTAERTSGGLGPGASGGGGRIAGTKIRSCFTSFRLKLLLTSLID